MANQSDLLQTIADELRTVAAFGLNFARHSYEEERWQQVLQASASLTAVLTHQTAENLLAQYQANHFDVVPMASGEAVVMRDGKILLVQRSDDGLWALPGGLTDAGETLAETAVRELCEETGIRGKAVQLLGIFDSRNWRSEKKLHFYHAVFQVEPDAVEIQPSDEVTAVAFFSEDELPSLSPGHHLRVPHVLRQLRGVESVPFFDERTLLGDEGVNG